MAEGGEDIPLDSLDPDRGEDDHDDDEHETSFGGDDWTRDSEKYKFPSTHHENQAYEPDESSPLIDPVERLERDKEAGEAFFREKFVNPDFRNLVCGLDDNGRYWVKLVRGGAKTHYVNEDLSNLSKLPQTVRQYLGDTREELLLRNDQIMEQNGETLRQLSQSRRAIKEQEERVKDLEKQNKKLSKSIIEKVEGKLRAQLEKSTSPGERKRLDEEIRKVKRDLDEERSKNQNKMRENNAEIDRLRQQLEDEPDGEIQRQIERLEAENERLGEQNEEIFSRMSLRDKVKYIFKKYGLTVFGVLAAVSTVIGVIVSNLKAGLTNVARGVGNGLKELGKKLGQILPGMVGAIVSFLFKAAGEAVGFLAKHAWLLIMLVVTFAVEQFKKK